ncbi:hypothetical protein AAH124_20465, partial [Phocaeicola vulgatus]
GSDQTAASLNGVLLFIIARGPADNLWFINPLIVFNGDRVTFAKTYVRKKTLAAQKKEEAEKRQLSLGFDEQ